MDFFDKLGETLLTAGRDVGQRAREVSEIAKLKLDIKAKEEYVQKQYAVIGACYYQRYKEDECCEEAEQFFLIKEALDEIARMRTKVLKIQGAVQCQSCGGSMPEGVTFCSNCGAKIDDMFEE